jgi:Tol biopolymer transport system component
MTLAAGTKLGAYEIRSPLGAGGMGEVYRARDPRLGRDVAVKVLPASFSGDPDRLRRFEQEARAAGQLNHPNVLTVYEFGVHEGAPFIVSELLEGEPLRERLHESAIPSRKAIEYAIQITHGLAAAHEKGIFHRDLKPENLFITTEGRVKILDFGLAKLTQPEEPSAKATSLPTMPGATEPGQVMGTVGYMSPEQVRAKPGDARTDIFAFGAILYEMVSGRRAFQRETTAETMAAILNEDPPELSTLGKNVSAGLERVVNHCLEKSAEQRFQSAKDLAFALSTLTGSESAARPTFRVPRRRALPLWAAVPAAMVAVLLAIFALYRPQAPAERMQFAIPVQAEVSHLSLSADGRMLVFVARDDGSGENMLYVERLGSPTNTLLAGTEGASYPFWSPDNAYVGFFANGKLEKVAVSGAPPQVLTTASFGRGGSWGSQGVIIYAPDAGGPLWRVNADGTNAALLTAKLLLANENSHRWPVFLPDGDHFLFWAGSFSSAGDERKNGIYISSLAVKEKKLLVPAHSNAGYANGHLYYVNERLSLIAVPFNVRSAAISGEPVILSDHITYQPSVYWGAFGVGGSDVVVYNTSPRAVLSVLTWYDRSGKELSRAGEPGVMANPSISPDGKLATVDITDTKTRNVDIWILGLDRSTSSRFTFDPAEEVAGVWSHDGRLVAYRSIARGPVGIAIKKATGLEAEKWIYSCPVADEIVPNSWTPDDKQILCSYQPASGGSDLVVVDAATGKMTAFVATKASETNGQISPDGKWVAYASNETGEWEIYVTTFPNAQGKWQASRGGGTEPRWRGDGREIFYIDPKGMLTAVAVSALGTFSVGVPSALFQIHGRAGISSTDLFTYAVAPDGKRFLVNRYVKPDYVQPLTVVLNAVAIKK